MFIDVVHTLTEAIIVPDRLWRAGSPSSALDANDHDIGLLSNKKALQLPNIGETKKQNPIEM